MPLHAVSIEFDLVQPVGAVRCSFNELGELRFDPGRRRSGFTPAADRDHVRRGSGMGFRHNDIHRGFLVLGRLANRCKFVTSRHRVPEADRKARFCANSIKITAKPHWRNWRRACLRSGGSTRASVPRQTPHSRASSAGRNNCRSPSPISARSRRLVGFQRRQRLGFCLGSDLGENGFPHLDPWRQRVTIGIDCVAEQPNECVGFLIG